MRTFLAILVSWAVAVMPIASANPLVFLSGNPPSAAGGSPPASPQLTETYDANPGNSGFDLTGWTSDGTGGTVDANHTSTVLAGAESLLITNASAGALRRHYKSITAGNERFIFFMFRATSYANTGELEIAAFWDSGFAVVAVATIKTGRTVTIKHGTAESSATVGTMQNDTTYYCKLRYNNTSDTASFEFSTTAWTFAGSGNNFCQTTSGNATTDAARVVIGVDPTDDTATVIYDAVYVDDDGS